MHDAMFLALGIVAAALIAATACRDAKRARRERFSDLGHDREIVRQKFAPAAANDKRAQIKYAQLKMHDGSYPFGAVTLRLSDPERPIV